MDSTFKVGDRVVALEDYDSGVKRGKTYTVTGVRAAGSPERNGMIELGEATGGIFGSRLKLVETKQEEAVQKIKVGDTVEVIDTSGGHGKKLGETFKVKAIEHDRYSSKELIVLDDPTRARTAAYAERFKVVQPKPEKVKSQKITVDQVQVGDEIVAFRHSSGVETRRKGVVGSIEGGKGRTKEGNILTHFYTKAAGEVIADHIYLLNRPEPKKPEIENGVYWVTEEGHHASPWKVTVTNEKAEWETKDGKYVYGTYENLVAVKSGKYESGPVASTKFHTEEPVKTLADGIYTVQWRDALESGGTYYWVVKGGKYWESRDLEYAKGMPHSGISTDGNWFKDTVAGDTSLTVPVPYVEPKGFDALDKTKTYLLRDHRVDRTPLDWYLAFKDGAWKYGSKWDITTTAGSFEDWFTKGTSSWDKPVECVEPKLTTEDLVGKKYRHENGLDYKVTAKGNVKLRYSDRTTRTDSWDRMGVTTKDLLRYIESGEAVEI